MVGDADTGEATFTDGSVTGLAVVGRDPLADLAVVRADRAVAAPPVYRDVDDLRIGSLVVAVGNPLGLAGSVTALGDAQSLQRQLFEESIGTRLEITVLRNGALVDAVAVPAELTD